MSKSEQLKKALKSFSVMPGLLEAQARYETGHFSSDLFKSYNNAFGMTYVGQEEATGNHSSTSPIDKKKYTWAHYNQIEDSVRDRIRLARVKNYHNEKDPKKFIYKTLENGYIGYRASESQKMEYANTWISLYNSLNNKNVSKFEKWTIEENTNKAQATTSIITLIILTLGILWALNK